MILLFDFDGVINKSEYFSKAYVKEYGIDKELIAQFFKNDFNKCATGEADIKQVLPAYLEKWNWEHSIEEFLEYWFNNDIQLDTQLLKFIRSIKIPEKHTCLASQQEINRKTFIWENIGLNTEFNDFYCTCDIGFLKSHKNFYLNILEDLEIKEVSNNPGDVFFFDDSEEFVATAKECGINAFHFQSNNDIYRVLNNWCLK